MINGFLVVLEVLRDGRLTRYRLAVGRTEVRRINSERYGDPWSSGASGIFIPAYKVRRGPYDGENTPIPLPLRIW
jgi:hypothetical protein